MGDGQGAGSGPGWIFENGKRGFVAGLVVALIGAGAAIFAFQAGLGRISADPQRARVEGIVREYILAHPEIIPEAVTLLQQKELAKVVDTHRAGLETPFAGAWAGAENGDVVLVEFFDYACTFCRASRPDIERLLKEDPGLKVVWREFPVLGEDSVAAARTSLAAAKQGRFKPFHDRMFEAGMPTRATLAKVQQAVGISAQASPDFDREIERNYELARAINATGTPVFVVGDKVLHGAVGYAALKDAIAEARKKG